MGSFDPKLYSYIVGIDFGTTYSGCSYAFTRKDHEEIVDITKWPKSKDNFYSKTPTVLSYKKGAKTTDVWGQHAYNFFWFAKGFRDNQLITRFKLLLNNDRSVPNLPEGLSVEGAIRDYLKGFHKHVCAQIAKATGNTADIESFRYCLTVPANWSEGAKVVMRQAAMEAGLINKQDHPDRLMLISEPEAAALYCQKHCEEFNLSDGEQFLICDAGGGTVDLVVFEIDGSGPQRRLKEITTARGENCGSTFLDVKMQALLKSKIGSHISISPITLEEMTKSFIEEHKPNFGDDDEEDEGIYFPIPAVIMLNNAEKLRRIGIEDGCLYISFEELREKVFEPVISRIIQLIDKQLNFVGSRKPMDAMFMVGGFSQSHYLRRRIKEEFEDRVKLISVAPRGEQAIVRGAVLLGLEPNLVSQRIAKHTYGLKTRGIFDPSIDPERLRLPGTQYCDVRFNPIVIKNEKLTTDFAVTQEYEINYLQPTIIDIYAYDNDDNVPRWTVSEGIVNLGGFILKPPKGIIRKSASGATPTLKVRFYFGKTEIKIETDVLGEITTFTLEYVKSRYYAADKDTINEV